MELEIVHFSDTHGQHERINLPSADIGIFSGDLSAGRGGYYETKAFLEWLSLQKHVVNIVMVFGNHDVWSDPKYEKETTSADWLKGLIKNYGLLEPGNHIQLLQNNSIDIMGLKIWGSPYSAWFHGDRWAWNLERGEPAKEFWKKIPDDTQLLITHGPGRYLDLTIHGHKVGDEDLGNRIEEIKPLLHCFGHIHEEYGVIERDGTIHSNASILANYHGAINQPNKFTLTI